MFIFWLSARSDVPAIPTHMDKIFHFIEYFGFAALLWFAVAKDKFWDFKIRLAIAVFLIAAAYAGSDEIHQKFVVGRNASIYDWFADVAGILGMLTLMLSRVKWRGPAVSYDYETI